MSLELTVPVIMLTMVFLAAPFLLIAERRERRLQQQITMIASLGTRDGNVIPSIRKEKLRFLRLREISRIVFCYDMALAAAYTVPMPFVVVGALLAGTVAGVLASMTLAVPLCWLIGCVVAAGALRGLFGWQRNRYTHSLVKQIPDALQFVVGAVRAGFPVMEALGGIAREVPEPTRAQFVQVVNEIALGRPVPEALLNVYHRTRVTEYAIFAVTLAVQTKTGGHLAETIQTLAETVRERITIAARGKALAGEATVSATILAVLPVVTGIALTVIRPDYLNPLFHDPRGKHLFLMAIAFLLTGVWVMRRMIAGAVKE